MTAPKLSRRAVLKGSAVSLVVLGTGGLAACSREAELSCTDTTGLAAHQIQMRQTLQYVDASPDANKRCDNCRFYEAAPAANQCGGCKLVPGPIHPRGYCTSWAASES